MEPVADGFESLRTLLAAIWSGVGSVVSTIASKPLLLIPVGLVFAAGAISLAKRLMGSGGRRRR